MVKVSRNYQMDQFIMACSSMGLSRGKAGISGQISVLSIQGRGRIMLGGGKGYISIKMAESIKETGRMGKCMGMGCILGPMAKNIMENFKMIKNMAVENLLGQMEAHIMATG